MRLKASLMDSVKMRRTLIKLAHIILGDNESADRIALVGIGSRGTALAREIASVMQAEGSRNIPVARLDPCFDAEADTRAARELGLSVSGTSVVIVNDVLRSGRTVLAVNDALFRAGMPGSVRLAVLVDGSNGQALMKANYVGVQTRMEASDIVSVSVKDVDGEGKVEVYNVE